MSPLTIWSNAGFLGSALDVLQQGLHPHRLVVSAAGQRSNLSSSGPDPLLAEADVAFGQPDPRQVIDSPRVRWVHLTSAGYTRYDTIDLRTALRDRGGVLTNSSAVYADPCAQHLLAMMLALARRLPQSMDEQRGAHGWPSREIRRDCYLLSEQQVLIYGYGAIARRLTELLMPFQMKITGVRRQARGDEKIPTLTPVAADTLLGDADHVVNILPASASTDDFFNADRFGRMKRSAVFYNIGRGSTTDHYALAASLETGRLAAAYLDVTTPEPLPPPSMLWRLPNCFITPHSAGGHRTEPSRLVHHFLANVKRYTADEPLYDLVF